MKRPVYEPVSAHELNKDPHDQDVMARSNMHLTEEEEYTHTHTHTRPYHNVLPLNFHFSDHGSGHQLRLISAVGFSLQMSLKGRKIILAHMLTTRGTCGVTMMGVKAPTPLTGSICRNAQTAASREEGLQMVTQVNNIL